jgi:hypothetical protein
MGARNLAMVFAPNMSDIADPMQVARISETSKEFLLALIGEWDVSDIYPLPDEMMREGG